MNNAQWGLLIKAIGYKAVCKRSYSLVYTVRTDGTGSEFSSVFRVCKVNNRLVSLYVCRLVSKLRLPYYCYTTSITNAHQLNCQYIRRFGLVPKCTNCTKFTSVVFQRVQSTIPNWGTHCGCLDRHPVADCAGLSPLLETSNIDRRLIRTI